MFISFGRYESHYIAIFDAQHERVILLDPPDNQWTSLTNGMERVLERCLKQHPECRQWRFFQYDPDGVFEVGFGWRETDEAHSVTWDMVHNPELDADIRSLYRNAK